MLRICAGRFKGKRLKLPLESVARPSSDKLRQGIFNILENFISFNGIRVLDGFAGSGALGLEALSRGAGQVTFCENNSKVRNVLKENVSNVIIPDIQVLVASDVFKLVSHNPFDLIFLDPPYDMGFEEKALQYLSDKKLIASKGIVVIEQRKGGVIKHQDFTVYSPRVYGKCQVTVLRHGENIERY